MRFTRALVVFGSVAMALSFAAAAGADSRATVTPSTGLANGQRVKVKWVAMHLRHATDGIWIAECNASFPTDSWSACTLLGEGARAEHGTVKVRVRAGAVGTDGGTCGTSSADQQCVIVAYGGDATGTALTGGDAVVPISFATP
jgi:hypothetical protein